jgi:hypothetical protein
MAKREAEHYLEKDALAQGDDSMDDDDTFGVSF